MSKLSKFDKFTMSVAPRWTEKRVRARLALETIARHYDAAQTGRRTSGWNRNSGDANAAIRIAVAELRLHARDLIRNNAWARRGQRVIANNTVGWGIVPKANGLDATENAAATALWKAWADSTECESEGRHTFYGLQHLAMKTIAEAGEVLIRRRWRKAKDDLTIPLQLQVLEPDYLDSAKDGMVGDAGGPIVQGVEFDKIGRRAAYWIFPEHPGSATAKGVSKRIPATEILHVYYTERPGQVRGVSWFGAAIANLKDLDDYEDAELLKQKIAACFAAFVTDQEGSATAMGTEDTSNTQLEELGPGMINYLAPGKSVSFANPPVTTTDSFANRELRRIAAALGIGFEDLTGDYEKATFSSARMSRLSNWENVKDWRFNMVIPLLCDGVWNWAMEAAVVAGELREAPPASWTCPPMAMIEPDKEGLAISRNVRAGIITFSEMIREQGGDPDSHFEEYAADLKKLDALEIQLDSDVRAVSQAGLTQVRAGGAPGGDGPPPKTAKQSADDVEWVEVEIDP